MRRALLGREVRRLLRRYGLDRAGWTWDWLRPEEHPDTPIAAKDCWGLCDFETRTLYFAVGHVETDDWAEVRDTVRHEVAHALARRGGHGAAWKAYARILGASTEAY